MKKCAIFISAILIQLLISNAVHAFGLSEFNLKVTLGPLSPGANPQFLNQVGLDGVENIRMMTGQVNLVHTDISMPVSKDLSIDIKRYYSSPVKALVGAGYLGGKSVLGLGWDIHMGRILQADYQTGPDGCKPKASPDNTHGYDTSPILELSDGTREPMFVTKDVSPIDYPFVTEHYWVLDCTDSGMVAYSADGMKYFF